MTGARLREVPNMRWDYVDLQAGQIHLPDSKTGRKTIFLSNKAKRYIGDVKRKPDNPYVFPGQREGSQLINIQKPWRLIRELAKLDGVRIHDLRHTYASLAVAQNLSLPIVGKLPRDTPIFTLFILICENGDEPMMRQDNLRLL